jgi:hypothetical protein
VVARLSTSAKTNSPVSDARVRAHESSSLGASSWAQRSRTAARASVVPPRASTEDGEGEFSKLMQRYRGTSLVAQLNHQVRGSRVSQPRGQTWQLACPKASW